MNSILTYFMISTMCIFGTKLSIKNSEFTEVLPGKATADVVTKFKVDIRSNGKKKIIIESIWVKNEKANWKIIDSNEKPVESLTDKKTYTLIGEIRTNQGSTKLKIDPPIEKRADYSEDFVISYKVGNSKFKLLKIDKIENLKHIRKQ